jgi:hypothetical protein
VSSATCEPARTFGFLRETEQFVAWGLKNGWARISATSSVMSVQLKTKDNDAYGLHCESMNSPISSRSSFTPSLNDVDETFTSAYTEQAR